MELDKFWIEEIRIAVKALKMRRIDPTDFERWNSFRASLERTTELWQKVWCPVSPLYIFLIDQNTLYRQGHQAVMPLPYAATMHALQWFALHVFFPFSFRLTVFRESTSGR